MKEKSLKVSLWVISLSLFAVACSPIGAGNPTCDAARCSGCCSAEGTCEMGTSASACGSSAGACVACSAGTVCSAQGVCEPEAGGGGEDAGTQCGAPTSVSPSARSDFASAYDPAGKQIVLFGGDPGVAVNCMSMPQFEGETWFYDVACRQWSKSNVSGPSARARNGGAYDGKRGRFLSFGGRFRAGTSGAYTNYNDVWALSFSAGGHAWEQLTTTGTPPPPMSSMAAAYDAKGDRLVVYGGNTSSNGGVFAPSPNVYALSLADNVWSELVPINAKPPARLFHSAVIDSKRDQLVVFGGGDANAFLGPFFNDTWSFDFTTRAWTKLAPSGPQPAARIRGVLVADPERDRVLLFGGHDDGTLGERNDLWSLELSANEWVNLRPGDALNMAGSGFCDFPSNFVTPDLESPERREAHGFAYVPGTGPVMVGGRSDCGVLSDVWSLDPMTAQWTQQKPTFVGLSCERSGKQNCTKLCF